MAVLRLDLDSLRLWNVFEGDDDDDDEDEEEGEEDEEDEEEGEDEDEDDVVREGLGHFLAAVIVRLIGCFRLWKMVGIFMLCFLYVSFVFSSHLSPWKPRK